MTKGDFIKLFDGIDDDTELNFHVQLEDGMTTYTAGECAPRKEEPVKFYECFGYIEGNGDEERVVEVDNKVHIFIEGTVSYEED